MDKDNSQLPFFQGAPEPVESDICGIPVTILPPGWGVHHHESLMETPNRAIIDARMSSLASFLKYVDRFGLRQSIINFTAEDLQIQLQCILDYHEPDEAGWCDHTATFDATATSAWAAWSKHDSRWMSQAEFAKFIYQNMPEIREPTGSNLLELVETLKATARGEFREQRDQHTGSTELIYKLTVKATGATQEQAMELPNQIKIGLTPFYGFDEIELQADLEIQIPKMDGGTPQMRFCFYRLEDVFQEMFTQVTDQVAEETGLPVFRC